MKTILAFFMVLAFQQNLFAADRQFYFTTSDSVALFVRIAGSGKPCLFLHGGPGSTSHYFEKTGSAPLLEEKLQMIYVDQRGSGRSKGNATNDYSLGRVLRDMEELRQHLQLKSWLLMGHSFGGLLITQYAYQYPASVKALVMVNGTVNIPYSLSSHINFGIQELKLTDAAYTDATLPAMQRLHAVHGKLTEAGVWYKLMFRNAFEKRWSDSTTNAVGHFNYSYGSKVLEMEEYLQDFAPLTAEIKLPVLVFTGTKDFAIGIDHYRSFRFPKQSLAVYVGGHCPFQEEPQWFAEKTLSFLSTIQ